MSSSYPYNNKPKVTFQVEDTSIDDSEIDPRESSQYSISSERQFSISDNYVPNFSFGNDAIELAEITTNQTRVIDPKPRISMGHRLSQRLSAVLQRGNVPDELKGLVQRVSEAQRQTILIEDLEEDEFEEIIEKSIQDTKKQIDLRKEKLDEIYNKAVNDTSAEARRLRYKALIRALIAEFVGSYLIFSLNFCCIIATNLAGLSPGLRSIVLAFVSSFTNIAMKYAFASISGAHLNPVVTFCLWYNKKVSNRKVFLYTIVHLLGSIIAVSTPLLIFEQPREDLYNMIIVRPANDEDVGKIFSTECILTFFNVFLSFITAYNFVEEQKKENMSMKNISQYKGLAVYSTTPQSKTGFSPFAQGLALFSFKIIKGTSNANLNLAQIFGPNIFAKYWDYYYIYVLGQFAGGFMAALIVTHIDNFIQITDSDREAALGEKVQQIIEKTYDNSNEIAIKKHAALEKEFDDEDEDYLTNLNTQMNAKLKQN